MMAHKLIDVLLKGGSDNFILVPGSDPAETARMLRLAEKFDFGDLHLEGTGRFHENGGEMMRVPTLTTEENDFLDEGLVPLPAPVCWYEFSMNGHHSGLLVKEGWDVTRIDFDWETGRGGLAGIWISRDSSTGNLTCKFYNAIQEKIIENPWMHPGSEWALSRYFTLMLNSKSTEIEAVRGARRLTGEKSLSKREPLPDHRIVRIVPRAYIAARQAEGEALRCPPRLHWRRSHLRHLADGRRIVIARCLVGKAEVGVVSHEYKVLLKEDRTL